MNRFHPSALLSPQALRLCLCGMMAAGSVGLSLQAQQPQRLDKLEQEN